MPSAEPMVWAIVRYMVKALFLAGHHTVILDATSVYAQHRREWKSSEWETVVHVVPTDAETCVRRAADNTGLVYAILRMNTGLEDVENIMDLRSYTWV